MKKMIWVFLMIGIILTLTACGSGTPKPVVPVPSKTAAVDILYLKHPPVLPILDEIDAALKPYGERVKVTRYDFDTPEGAAFAQKMGITGHDPLAIFVNGFQSFNLSGRTVTFNSFPQGGGAGGMVPNGDWSIADLGTVLKIILGQ
jgi:hypothetical protein